VPPTSNYLIDIGYTGLALPRRNIAPLDLLLTGGDGPWTRIGPLEQVVGAGGVDPPGVDPPDASPDIGGKVTRKLEIGFALKILSSFLQVFGASAGLEAKYARATEADLSFEDVTMEFVNLAPLDMYLGAGEVNTAARNVMLWLNDGKCVIVTNVLRSPKITITALHANEGSVEVQVPEIAQAVEGRVNVSASSERSSRVTFEAAQGELGVAFGFQALQLNYSGNVFHTWRTVNAAKVLRDPNAREEDRAAALLEELNVMPVRERALLDIEDKSVEDVPAPAGAGG
jgi:hypothetical protein